MDIPIRIKNFIINQPNVVLALIGLILGIIIATEYSQKIPRIINPVISNMALDEMETKLVNEQSSLKEQQEVLDSEITDFQANLNSRQSGLSSMVSDVGKLKDQSGLTAKSGEGIEIVIDDSDKNDENANAIAHASDLRDLVDFMWTRGAQAISIQAAGSVEERVIFTTSIDCIVNTVLINNTKSTPPFKIKILGKRDSLLAAVEDRGSLKNIYERVEKNGLLFYPTDNSQINIPKYSGNLMLDHAKVQ